LAVFSCSKENTPTSERHLVIYPTMAKMTKSIVDNSNIFTKEIGIQITNEQGDNIYQTGNYQNLSLKNVSNIWKFYSSGAEFPVILTDQNAKIYAIYPYSSTIGAIKSIGETAYSEISLGSEVRNSDQIDYLWGAQSETDKGNLISINKSNHKVVLNLQHILSSFALVIYRDGYEGAGNITKVEIAHKSSTSTFKVKDVGNNLKVNLSNGEIFGGTTSSFFRITDLSIKIPQGIENHPGYDVEILKNLINCNILFPPIGSIDKSNFSFKITIDDATLSTPSLGSGILDVKRGFTYFFILRLNQSSIGISGISPWIDNNQNVSSGF
jgi:hypothetical protein